MATTSGGRLQFCPHTSDDSPGGIQRKEYMVVRDFGTDYFDGYAALCPCVPGDHFLAPWGPDRSIGEYTADATMTVYQYPTAADARAAIEIWQTQQTQQTQQARSSETPPERA
jgi:hypothetical protein